MKKPLRSGFTIVEVILVLAISMMLFVALLANIATNVYRQRYNDSVQSFGEFLRSAYSDVINVENFRRDGASNFRACTLPGQAKKASSAIDTNYDPGYLGYPGRTECAIYGKLLTFGETDKNDKVYDNPSTVRVYDIIGDAINSGAAAFSANTTLDALKLVNADALAAIYNESTHMCDITSSGNTTTYTPTWGARVENINGEIFTGSVLIVRSPLSGAVHTYLLTPDAIKIKDELESTANSNVDCNTLGSKNAQINSVVDYLTKNSDNDNDPKFEEGVDVNFCIKSDDLIDLNGRRRNVRILANGRNVTAVSLIDADSEDNVCAN